MTVHAKAAPSLAALIEPAAFGEIWCRSTWLSDELELRRDHRTLRALLKLASTATSAGEMQPALQAAMDLFRLHAAIVHEVLECAPLRSTIEHLLMLIEQLETTDPEEPLYIAQAAELNLQLQLLMTLENDCFERLGQRSSAGDLDADLLHARQQLLRDADLLVKSRSLGRPLTQRLC